MLNYDIRSLKDDEIFSYDIDIHVPHNLHEIVTLTVEKVHVYMHQKYFS